jgi:hypothetical protein
MVPFQFNPETITRAKSASAELSEAAGEQAPTAIEQLKQSLWEIEKGAGFNIKVEPETIELDIRLDAEEKLAAGDPITKEFGIAPQLSALELMIYPKKLSLASMAAELVGASGWNYLQKDNPPIVLFVWGRKKVLPVFITRLSIKEEVFDANLNPIRAVASVSLTVIEGNNIPFMYTKGLKDAMAAQNIYNITDLGIAFIPK